MPNLVLAAVHLLLLDGIPHPLSAFFPSVAGDTPRDGDPFPDFRAFCLEHREVIAGLVATRRVQTNEVQRCVVLLPAFGLVARSAGGRPLALVEVGASAGLNLLWDRYGYDYGDGRRCGDLTSAVQLACTVRGERQPPIPDRFPAVASRVGIDLDPVDVRDADATRWLRALVWPEHHRRADGLQRAIDLAREAPPPLVAGDALDVLPELLGSIDRDSAVCVFHTFTLNQFAPEARDRLGALLAEHAATRPLYRVSIEWLSEGLPPLLRLSTFPNGVETKHRLAHCNGHARWLEWLADAPGTS